MKGLKYLRKLARAKPVVVREPSCPFCGSFDVYKLVGTLNWYCRNCHRQFRRL